LSAKLALSGFKAETLTRPARVLDVGCGVGAQLDMFKALLPSAECYGVEIGELAVRKTRSKGHTAYHGRFEDIDLPQGYFDIVYSSHVIEHVEDPMGFLAKCSAVSSPQAIIIIETPNTDCVEFEFLKARHWGGYHAPRHFYLFNPKNMTTMAARTGLSEIVARSYLRRHSGTGRAIRSWRSLCRTELRTQYSLRLRSSTAESARLSSLEDFRSWRVSL
jgi:2-polyprenyl-3-methyl-5-hydroxy-6-metoxy-1,4-benzoquinol methylase